MGREIRRVPPNWEHPKNERGYIPLYDESYLDAITEWIDSHQKWLKGEHKDQIGDSDMKRYKYYADWAGNPPDVDSYRPEWKEDQATWFQVYETVSEGTPVTPPFATAEELVEYLATKGDFWDQQRGDGPWSRHAAQSFCLQGGYVPSAMIVNGKFIKGRDVPGMEKGKA